MKPEIKRKLKKIDTGGWKKISVEFGSNALEIAVPPNCVDLSMKPVTLPADPQGAIDRALSHPIHSPALEEIVKRKGKRPDQLVAAITVSDITRPVPYRGENGILLPILKRLEAAGIERANIQIIVGTGTHRASTAEEKIEMYGEEVLRDYRVVDHDCEDQEGLTYVGKTQSGTKVYLNSLFHQADIKIATGLVETHFMTGVSGGRKAVCPGLVDKRTIEKFHSPAFLESPYSDNLVVEKNPCHQEALEVARAVGVDFIVNVTLDKDMKMTGVFAGDLEKAHLEAFQFMKSYTAIPVRQEADIVLTHGGYVGRDHYQTAKAACGALGAVKSGGILIIAADNRDAEPIGGPEYRSLVHLLKLQGTEGYVKIISDPAWRFTRDQWEAEVWARALKKVGEENLIYCTLEISEEDYCLLPGRCGLDFIKKRPRRPTPEHATTMVQNAVLYAVSRYREKGLDPTMAFIREGPYAVPVKVP